ncbi:amidase domain-containing protein [Streptomyces sp. Je 1-4]|uniref:amidase domain-containing protein n=1 Tax=Streptomyces TaxID=1883 RepID=UPI0021DA71CA|nr:MULTISPECIES: amidase domain-containing protein [unclassified Streptomyces]UYB41127.1 amidase domain-containing protein [Streptomyces sp. Je 1-4]UZQ37297.1 amidase domain-containing protein [Streptomyces sp. Je 1-4] [Streptomyces sp. Je 1-4 4N24]UZQ44714.1 amidase domain-containing protein [Streptomyces sp. Je 1-4] [Streptomyces sp. Je 1-4 4N24_ara]
MVTYAELISAHPQKWKDAADDWAALAKYALNAANDVREQGAKPLADNWADEVGAAAAGDFVKLADQLESAYDLLLSVKMVMEGMHSSLETAMSTACQITDLSRAHDLPLGDDGMPLQCPAPNAGADTQQAYNDIVALREHALRQATEADEKTAAELYRLAGTVGISDPEKALKEQNRASHVEMDILAAEIPKPNTDPAAVRAWWNGLSEKQQYDLARAEPVKLAQLDGIPESTKREMRGTDGKFDRVKMVEYALENWNKEDPVDFGNNCTNFVSNALAHAGMQEKTSFWEGTRGDDTWMKGNPTGIPLPGFEQIDRSLGHSKTWAGAENQKSFMLGHGGEEVDRSQARPGDIIYYDQAGPNDGLQKGAAHHAAIVTGVMPDGEIKYTQHSDPYQNASLQGRLPAVEKGEGQQRVRIVRPHPDWY